MLAWLIGWSSRIMRIIIYMYIHHYIHLYIYPSLYIYPAATVYKPSSKHHYTANRHHWQHSTTNDLNTLKTSAILLTDRLSRVPWGRIVDLLDLDVEPFSWQIETFIRVRTIVALSLDPAGRTAGRSAEPPRMSQIWARKGTQKGDGKTIRSIQASKRRQSEDKWGNKNWWKKHWWKQNWWKNEWWMKQM